MIRPALAVGFALALAGCPKPAAPPPPPPPDPPQPPPLTLRERVIADFEVAVLTSQDAFEALFDFAAVGEMEILLHRYDLNGRLPNLDDQQKAELAAEDGTPYPAEREEHNVGEFYKILGQRTVGTGECVGREPRTRYGKLLGTYPPLPEGTPPKYEELRAHANAWLAKGGVVGIKCRRGRGGLVLVYTAKDKKRGYDLITIYDD
jgi:hypothetical protein